MKLKNLALILTVLVVTSSCKLDDTDEPKSGYVELHYVFEKNANDWTSGFADYPKNDESDYELQFEYTKLPTPLDTTKGALKLSGNNQSSDLFMYVKRKVVGLEPNKEYIIGFNVNFASNIADTTVGAGVSAGENVYIKAGVSNIEPDKVLQEDGMYRMNVAIGNQSQAGSNTQVLGDFSNDTAINQYTHKILSSVTGMKATSNAEGELWFLVGTDSGFEGITTIYLDRISIFFYWEL